MGVAQVGNDDEVRSRPFHHPAHRADGLAMAQAQLLGDLHVMPAEGMEVIGPDAEAGQRRAHFLAATGAPAGTRGRIDHEAPLHPALRPRVVVAVGQQQHVDTPARPQHALDQHAGGQRFVIGMRGDDEEAGAAVDDRMA